jgi:hypothetical protein
MRTYLDTINERARSKMKDMREDAVSRWAISRRVDLAAPRTKSTVGASRIVTTDFGRLSIGSPMSVDAGQAFTGELTVEGLVDVKVPVVIKVVPFATNAVELSMQVSGRFPRVGLSTRRYFKAAWSVVDELFRAIRTEDREAFEELELAA